MSNNIFLRLSYEDVKASLMDNVRAIHDQNPIVGSMLCGDKLVEAFTSYVTQRGIFDQGNVQITLIRDAGFKYTHLFISGFARENTTKSITIKEWRNFLENALKYHWKYFWPDFLKERYDSCLELANYRGESEVQVAEAKELLKGLSFNPWIQSLVSGQASRLPSREDFEFFQAHDKQEISMIGFFTWVYHTKTVGFRWVETDEKIRRGTFYRHINQQINTIRSMMLNDEPKDFARCFGLNVLEDSMRVLQVYSITEIYAMLKNSARLKEAYSKVSTSSSRIASFKEMAERSLARSHQKEPPVVHSFESPQFFVPEMKTADSWFAF